MNKLKINDKIYGEHEIDSPVLVDLISSTTVQRLKGINQFGVPDIYSNRKSYSRYDHSVGVMLLLREFRASEEEQIAGLLHDVSHRAFSHIYDWVVGTNQKEDAQDKIHVEFLKKSDASKILRNYGFDEAKVASLHDYPLLDRDIPDLCADRIDYSLRSIDSKTAKKIMKGLKIVGGLIVCKDLDTAKTFGNIFLDLQTGDWASPENVVRSHLFANVLRDALSEKIIKESDFFQNDLFVLEKLENLTDKRLRSKLDILKQKTLPKFKGETTLSYAKFRYIDPYLLVEGKLKQLSSLDSQYKKRVHKEMEKNNKGVVVPRE